MARKDLEKETERPRYYSQFWLDVAAGRRVIGAGKGARGEEAEAGETESAPELSTKAGKGVERVQDTPSRGGRASRSPASPAAPAERHRSLADLVAAAGLVDLEADEEIANLEEGNVSTSLVPLPAAEEATDGGGTSRRTL